MLTVSEVSEILKISKPSVYKLIHAGELGAYRFCLGDKAFRVSEEDLVAYLEASRIKKEEPPRRAAPLRHIKL